MKKIILMIAALLVMTGCGQPGEYTLSNEEYERLIQLDGPMFTYSRQSNDLVFFYDDFWEESGFTVYYDGTIERFTSYNLSGKFTSTATLEKDDYITIYEFCRNWMQSDKNGVYAYGGCEQDSYSFDFYDEDGERNCLYFTDHVSDDKLKEIVDIYKKYDIKIEVKLVFNVYQYVDPSTPVLFVAEYNEAKNTGYKCECITSGTMKFGSEYCEGMDWYIYIRSEDPTANRGPYILESSPDIYLEDDIEVKKGDLIFIYPEYHGEGEPPEVNFWGYYPEYEPLEPYRGD